VFRDQLNNIASMMGKKPRSATIKEIAEAAGVSIAAVSYTLSGKKKLSPDTTARIRKIADQLGYIPNKLARNLKTRISPIIGIVVPDIRNPFFPAIMDGVSHYLSAKGYEVFVSSSGESEAKQKRILTSFLQYRLAGIIAMPTGDPDSIIAAFTETVSKSPLVLIDRDIPLLDCAKVLLDNSAGAEELTMHLLKSGHKKIGIIAPPASLSIGRERLSGYGKALRAYRLKEKIEYIYRGDLFAGSGPKALNHFLSLPAERRPTAIISCGDVMTVGLLQALKRRGIKIPQDLSVVTFDDTDFFSLLDPPLTCLSQPTEVFGKEAARLLTDSIECTAPSEKVIRLKGTIKIRDSVLRVGRPLSI
jgi:LacI family transcriptional regulator